MIDAICVVVDESKCLDTPILKFLGTGPAGLPRKPQVSIPSKCSSRNNPPYGCQDLESPALHVLETCQKGPLGLRGRSGIRTSSRCHRTGEKWPKRHLSAGLPSSCGASSANTPWAKRCPTQRRERHTR